MLGLRIIRAQAELIEILSSIDGARLRIGRTKTKVLDEEKA